MSRLGKLHKCHTARSSVSRQSSTSKNFQFERRSRSENRAHQPNPNPDGSHEVFVNLFPIHGSSPTCVSAMSRKFMINSFETQESGSRWTTPHPCYESHTKNEMKSQRRWKEESSSTDTSFYMWISTPLHLLVQWNISLLDQNLEPLFNHSPAKYRV